MRTATFIDGQNLYHLAKNAWSSHPSDRYGWPSYDIDSARSESLWMRALSNPLLHGCPVYRPMAPFLEQQN